MDLFEQLSRWGDPPTSKAAAMEVAGESFGDRMRLAYSVLKANQGRTSNELDRAAGFADGTIRKRLNDLRKFGFAKASGYRKCNVSGKRCQLWWVAGRPESELADVKGDAPGFERFWAAYPRKTAKKAALKAFAKLAPSDELLGKMLAALARQSATIWAGKELSFVPHAATWMNGERWEDDVLQGFCGNKPVPANRRRDFDCTTEEGKKAWAQKYKVPTESELARAQELLRDWRKRRGIS